LRTHAKAILVLESGEVFTGRALGAATNSTGEIIFNTGMTGYQEVFSDPSYYEQIIVMTSPHIGNTGINSEDDEGKKLYCRGVVMREYDDFYSNWRAEQSLHAYLEKHGVPGIYGVDTRRITQILRDKGAQRAAILHGDEQIQNIQWSKVPSMEGLDLVSKVSCTEPYFFHKSLAKKILVYDYGVKRGILQSLKEQGWCVQVVPYNFPFQDVLKEKPQAVLLSNGPGDPEAVENATPQIQGLIGKLPILAICMGHQLLARAVGAKTFKLQFGHHGVNHPVQNLTNQKVYVTSQNHGFAVAEKDLAQQDIKVNLVSLNDGSVEGFFSKKMKFLSVQFHPEANPGPRDASEIFEQFSKEWVL